jgi:hypothetical protein
MAMDYSTIIAHQDQGSAGKPGDRLVDFSVGPVLPQRYVSRPCHALGLKLVSLGDPPISHPVERVIQELLSTGRMKL